MTQDQVKASEILFDVVKTLEPRLAVTESWYKSTVQTIDKWFRSEGDQGIKRAKEALGKGWLAILGEDPGQPMSFTKGVGSIPNLVFPLVERVKSLKLDARLLSSVLSLIRVTDLWKAQGDQSTVVKQLAVINDSRLPVSSKKVIAEFNDFVVKFIDANPDSPFAQAYAQALKVSSITESTADKRLGNLYSEKAGPNGSLSLNAHKDYVTLHGCRTHNTESSLWESVMSLADAVCENQQPGCTIQSTDDWCDIELNQVCPSDIPVSVTPGKLSQINEKSGKVRLVACPDYWSQKVMKPIHMWLANLLRAIPMDCTYDQRSAIPKIVQWQKTGSTIYSFDQSSCTDLFPVDCQLIVLRNRFGDALTEAAKTVMCDRDWKVKLPNGQTKTVRWSVGQPMGLYGSWPLMAVAHHLLVQYAAWRSSGRKSLKPFTDYVICGDDIVIAKKSTAESYLKVVRDLGMKINLTKSHISGGSTGVQPVSEFAKITIWNGKSLFPVRPNMVLRSVKDWRLAVPLLTDLANTEGFHVRMDRLQRLVKKHYPTKSRYLLPLITTPVSLGGVGFRDSKSLKSKFTLIGTDEIHPWLYFLGSKIRSALVLEQRRIDIPLDEVSALHSKVFRTHPVVEYVRDAHKRRLGLPVYQDRIPSVREICKDILQEGYERYSAYLTGIDDRFDLNAPLPVWADTTEKEQLHQRTLWEKSLQRRHRWSKKDLEQSMIESKRIESLGLDEYSSRSFILDPFNQYVTVSNVLISRRFA